MCIRDRLPGDPPAHGSADQPGQQLAEQRAGQDDDEGDEHPGHRGVGQVVGDRPGELGADDGTAENWSSDFDLWAAEMLDAGRVDALADFRRQAPGMPHAHPTVEHFTPLFITLGAASSPDVEVRTRIEGFKIGLSKRSIEMS